MKDYDSYENMSKGSKHQEIMNVTVINLWNLHEIENEFLLFGFLWSILDRCQVTSVLIWNLHQSYQVLVSNLTDASMFLSLSFLFQTFFSSFSPLIIKEIFSQVLQPLVHQILRSQIMVLESHACWTVLEIRFLVGHPCWLQHQTDKYFLLHLVGIFCYIICLIIAGPTVRLIDTIDGWIPKIHRPRA